MDMSPKKESQMQIVRPLAALASAAVLSLGTVSAVHAAPADKPGGEPCAQQQAQVDKAQDALTRVTAVFAHQQTKVERLQDKLAAATTPEDQARLQAKLTKAMAQKQHTKKEKKAQVKRLEKAEARLADCQAANAG
jgi:septal ring factor EnvC (AmiA/AmiB activator)